MKRILYVEDDDLIRDALQFQLEENGYAVFPCKRAKEAIGEIESGLGYELAIVDLCLGDNVDRDGRDVIRVSRRINASVPIIACSGYSFEHDNTGDYDACFYKIRENEELLAIVRRFV